MSGHINGVQAKIKQLSEYVHCYAHQLNLVMTNTASINRNERIFVCQSWIFVYFFSTSSQRTAILDKVVQKHLPKAAPIILNIWNRTVNQFLSIEKTKELICCIVKIITDNTIKHTFVIELQG